jgi:hypothetical protein
MASRTSAVYQRHIIDFALGAELRDPAKSDSEAYSVLHRQTVQKLQLFTAMG